MPRKSEADAEDELHWKVSLLNLPLVSSGTPLSQEVCFYLERHLLVNKREAQVNSPAPDGP